MQWCLGGCWRVCQWYAALRPWVPAAAKTRQKVVIGDCGELPSRRQILAKMAAEKEALANMKKDPLQVYSAFLPITLNDSTCRVCHDEADGKVPRDSKEAPFHRKGCIEGFQESVGNASAAGWPARCQGGSSVLITGCDSLTDGFPMMSCRLLLRR